MEYSVDIVQDKRIVGGLMVLPDDGLDEGCAYLSVTATIAARVNNGELDPKRFILSRGVVVEPKTLGSML